MPYRHSSGYLPTRRKLPGALDGCFPQLRLLLLILCTPCLLFAAKHTVHFNEPDSDGFFVPHTPFVYDPVARDLGDPTILFDKQTGKPWIFYTQRPHLKVEGSGWYHGSPVGILSSGFGGLSWLYRGTAEGLDGAFEPGRNGFWAPEVICHNRNYHMYVTFIRGVPLYGGPAKYLKEQEDRNTSGILHFTSSDLLRWRFVSRLPLKPDNGFVIDACVHPLRDGSWRMWYRARTRAPGEDGQIVTSYSDSRDLVHWKHKGFGPAFKGYGEGPHVFHWKGWFWILQDGMTTNYSGNGLAVFRSKDATQWQLQPGGLLNDRGSRLKDGPAGHASVAVQGNRAFLLYQAFNSGECSGQLAELFCQDGLLTASREVRPMKLEGGNAPAFRGGRAPNFHDIP